MWLRKLNTEITRISITPIMINVDNQGALSLAKDTIVNDRKKHLDVKYHYIRSMVSSEDIKLQSIYTGARKADVTTKPFLVG